MIHSSSRVRKHISRRNFQTAYSKRDGYPMHIDAAAVAAQHIEHEPERYAAHSCYHRLYGMRRRADRILEVERWTRVCVYICDW